MTQVVQTNLRNLRNFCNPFRKAECTRVIVQERKYSKAVWTLMEDVTNEELILFQTTIFVINW